MFKTLAWTAFELEEGMMGIYFFGSRGADSTLFFEYL
jgi:hypothetical protein